MIRRESDLLQMHTPCQPPEIEWRDAVIPVARRFDDPYFSLQGGLAETRHVFLAGNGLPDRLRDGFSVAELGFGTGLNLLALQQAWAATGRAGQFLFTSFEAFPMPAEAIGRALSAFPELGPVAAALVADWQAADLSAGHVDITLPGVRARVILGDARLHLPQWDGRADAWFLDGFSPARNPELWQEDLLAEVARHTAPGIPHTTLLFSSCAMVSQPACRIASIPRAPSFPMPVSRTPSARLPTALTALAKRTSTLGRCNALTGSVARAQ